MSDTGILISLEDEEVFRSKVVLDYTSRDFTAVRSQLVGLARGLMPEWETAGEASDFGTLLIELFAYMGDVMHFYIDRTASEAFLGTALRRQSILYIADMMGYTPIGQQAASVALEFVLDANAEGEVVIPVGTRVYNETNNAEDLVVFELNTEVVLQPGDTRPDPNVVDPPAVFATEGVTIRDDLLGTSKGIPNNEFIIPNKGVIFNTVSIQTNEAGQTLPWTFITDMSLARPTQAVFTTWLDDQEYTHILFGDNASGRIPPVNADLYVTYRYGVGARANSLGPNAINTIAASSVPSDTDLWGVSVRNPQSPLGGTDPETADAMRYSIPRAAARVKSRAVTLADYADLALQVPGVAKSVSHGTVYTAVHVKIAPTGGQASDDYMRQLCEDVEYYMADKIMVGSAVFAEPETVAELWQDVFIRVTLHVTEGFNRSSVRRQVEALIRQGLSFDAVDFGYRITIGKIYRMALAIQGVEWAEVMWLNTVGPTKAQDQAMAPTDAVTTPGTVTNIETGELLIPRIFPPLPPLEANVTNKELTSNIAKLTTAINPHSFVVGGTIDVTGVDAVFNGRFVITATTGNTVSYAKVAADVATAAATGKISRIDTARPESETDFDTSPPSWTEEERTHDGLWVWAVGGTPGT